MKCRLDSALEAKSAKNLALLRIDWVCPTSSAFSRPSEESGSKRSMRHTESNSGFGSVMP